MSGQIEPLGAVLDALDMDIDALFGASPYSETPADLVALLRRLETIQRRMASGTRRVLAHLDQRGVAGELGARSTSNLLQQTLLITAQDASARVHQARDYAPRVSMTGEAMDPLFPLIGSSLDSGALSLGHARVIATTIERLPVAVQRVHGAEVEEFLCEQAQHLNPTQLHHVATRLRDTLDPDGKNSDEEDHRRRRSFNLAVHADGSSTPSGHWSPELTAAIRPVLDALSAPNTADGAPDQRTAGQRRHDAMLDISLRLLRSGGLPDSGGCPVSIQVTVSAEDLANRTGYATDTYGGQLSLGALLLLASEAEVNTIVLNVSGGILDFGRTRRLASVGQRKALAARDRGCSFPGCTCPSVWAEVHHILEWIRGGGTDINNLVLLCGYHHRNFERDGWQVRMSQDGMPEWIPPAWLDEQRRPRRNSVNDHLEPGDWDYAFEALLDNALVTT